MGACQSTLGVTKPTAAQVAEMTNKNAELKAKIKGLCMDIEQSIATQLYQRDIRERSLDKLKEEANNNEHVYNHALESRIDDLKEQMRKADVVIHRLRVVLEETDLMVSRRSEKA